MYRQLTSWWVPSSGLHTKLYSKMQTRVPVPCTGYAYMDVHVIKAGVYIVWPQLDTCMANEYVWPTTGNM